MPFIVKNCVRCGIKNIQMIAVGQISYEAHEWEVSAACTDCKQLSIWRWRSRSGAEPMQLSGNLEKTDFPADVRGPVRIATTAIDLSEYIPDRIADLFREANECRQMTWYEAAGAMYRKTVDVATKHIYSTDERLAGKEPANALRSRIKALGEMKILEMDIVELADVAAIDGNDATHDVDPYTADEAEALEDLTMDLLDRLFVRPARLAAVKAKQIAAGQRKT